MKSNPIVQVDNTPGNPLRLIAQHVSKAQFGTPELKDIIRKMQKALSHETDGVAIAAPQIGVSLRIFAISPSAYEEDAKFAPLVFINPTIIKRSKKVTVMQEGCLSVRWVYGKTKRSIAATVEAYDVDGNKFTYGGQGLLAHIFQHEIDHLEGILFIDHGFDLEEYTEEEVKSSLSKK